MVSVRSRSGSARDRGEQGVARCLEPFERLGGRQDSAENRHGAPLLPVNQSAPGSLPWGAGKAFLQTSKTRKPRTSRSLCGVGSSRWRLKGKPGPLHAHFMIAGCSSRWRFEGKPGRSQARSAAGPLVLAGGVSRASPDRCPRAACPRWVLAGGVSRASPDTISKGGGDTIVPAGGVSRASPDASGARLSLRRF